MLRTKTTEDLISGLRRRALHLRGDDWELPATQEMMREAADKLQEYLVTAEHLQEYLVAEHKVVPLPSWQSGQDFNKVSWQGSFEAANEVNREASEVLDDAGVPVAEYTRCDDVDCKSALGHRVRTLVKERNELNKQAQSLIQERNHLKTQLNTAINERDALYSALHNLRAINYLHPLQLNEVNQIACAFAIRVLEAFEQKNKDRKVIEDSNERLKVAQEISNAERRQAEEKKKPTREEATMRAVVENLQTYVTDLQQRIAHLELLVKG